MNMLFCHSLKTKINNKFDNAQLLQPTYIYSMVLPLDLHYSSTNHSHVNLLDGSCVIPRRWCRGGSYTDWKEYSWGRSQSDCFSLLLYSTNLESLAVVGTVCFTFSQQRKYSSKLMCLDQSIPSRSKNWREFQATDKRYFCCPKAFLLQNIKSLLQTRETSQGIFR